MTAKDQEMAAANMGIRELGAIIARHQEQIKELREGVARMEHMAQNAQTFGVQSIYVQHIIDEARRLRAVATPAPAPPQDAAV